MACLKIIYDEFEASYCLQRLRRMSKVAPYVAFLAGILLALIAAPEAVRTIAIAQHSQSFTSTRADLLQNRTQKHQKGPDTQVVEFRYRVGDRELKGDNYWTRTSDTAESVKDLIRVEKDKRKTILVFYDPKEPKRVVIHKEVSILMPIGILVVTVLLLFASVMSFLTDRRRTRMIERNKPR